jgi:solute carrier family 25 (mitochondrial carnitine/acylcarnitine transporter), member 20/29
MSSPLVGAAALNAVLFASYGLAKQWLQEDSEDELTIQQAMLAGTFAGFAQTFIISPTELVKARLQVQYSSAGGGGGGSAVRVTPEYNGAIDCVRKTIRRHGVGGMFAGMSGTLYRELPSYAVCFGVYEYLRIVFARDEFVDDLGPGT